MENLEQIVAANLTELRKARKWTQAELAEKINYSDKSVSKWERGEALPDLKVLKQMADLFEVSLDYFTTENAAAEKEKFNFPKSENRYRIGVELLAVSIVWIIAVSIFISTQFYSKGLWMAFVWAVPASALVLVLFNQHWKFRVCTIVFRSIFCWTLLAALFLQLLLYHPRYNYNVWTLFLIGLPAQAAIILWAQIRHNRF